MKAIPAWGLGPTAKSFSCRYSLGEVESASTQKGSPDNRGGPIGYGSAGSVEDGAPCLSLVRELEELGDPGGGEPVRVRGEATSS